MRKPHVYGASKTNEWPTWLALADSASDIVWTARWPSLSAASVSDDPSNCRQFWLHDFADIQHADYVLVLPPQNGVLRGALVEAGYGIALGKHVVLIGRCPDYGTWQRHPMVSRFDTIEEALAFIRGAWK